MYVHTVVHVRTHVARQRAKPLSAQQTPNAAYENISRFCFLYLVHVFSIKYFYLLYNK